jgi:excisionase family DNA binding protein
MKTDAKGMGVPSEHPPDKTLWEGEALPPFLTPAQLALRWQCGDTFIYNEIHKGNLPAIRLGGKLLRISQEAVEAYECRSRTQLASSPAAKQTEGLTGHIASNTGKGASASASHLARLTRLQHR